MRWLLLAVFAIALPAAAAAPVPKHLMPKGSQMSFPIQVGTTWVYETPQGEKTVVIIESKEQNGTTVTTSMFVQPDGKKAPHQVLSISDTGVFVISIGDTHYAEPWCLVKFPYRENETWIVKKGVAGDGVYTAGPFEKLKVPAGHFTAARISYNGTLMKPGMIVGTYWYAHGIGLVNSCDAFKLKSFTPGKG
ncbi:unnamed protein product [Gemmata massiliana]|uniref:IgGFc-binding protein N-terminal domain-containing protein n=1 Tax=Gemmata massiliana TaxID=1210884 RepID=A0A6P2CY70_9BACT|nr:hypothetical protein [Gemmata massiliana]VTR92140.1 unnamed protein product [Gemmata massiliana]